MTWAGRVALKNLESLAHVVEIQGGSSHWFSTIPLSAKTEASPVLRPVKLPAIKVDPRGGGVQVTSLSVEVLDKPGGTYAAPVSVLYSTALLGAPINVYMGFSGDTAWNSTNFPMRWSGHISSITWDAGVWKIQAEDWLGWAKKQPLVVDEAYATLNGNFDTYQYAATLEDFHGDISTPVLIDALGGAIDGTSTTGWTEGDKQDPGITPSIAAAGGYIKFGSDTDNQWASYYYDLALPSDARVGDHYACAVTYKRDTGTVTVVGIVSLYGLDAGDNVQEHSVSQGLVATTTNRTVANSIIIMDPTTTQLRIKVAYRSTDFTISGFWVDSIVLYRVEKFATLGRGLFSLASLTRDTGAVTLYPGACGSIQGSDSTGAYIAADGDTFRVCRVVAGPLGTVLCRLLTTTKDGGNGAYDYADGFGLGIDSDYVDLAAIAALDASWPNHALCFVVDKTVTDPHKWLDDEILKPCGLWMHYSKRGLVTVTAIPSSVGTGTHSLTETGMVSRSKVALDLDKMVNQVWFYSDHDPLQTMEGLQINEPKLNIKERPADGAPSREERFLGRYLFDEEDYHTDYVWRDQSKTSAATYGVKPYQVKSTGVRSLVSRQYGLPCPGYLYDTNIGYMRGEDMARSLATRLLTYYSSPVGMYTYHGFLSLAEVEIGDTVRVTDSRIPDLSPSGGGFGVTDVDGFVIGKDEGVDRVTLTCVLADWASPVSSDQPTHDTPTDPGSGNLSVVYGAAAAAFATGLFTDIPTTTFAGRVFKHNYLVNMGLPKADLAISAADTGADTVTITGHQLVTGDEVVCYMPGTAPTTDPAGLMATGSVLYAIVVDADTLQLARTKQDAAAGTAIDITDAGSGNRYLLSARVTEWAASEARYYMGSELGFVAVARVWNPASLYMLGTYGTSDGSWQGGVAGKAHRVYWLLKDGTYSANYYEY